MAATTRRTHLKRAMDTLVRESRDETLGVMDTVNLREAYAVLERLIEKIDIAEGRG